MTDKETSFFVCLPDPNEALQALERAKFEFESLLDYVAANHPQKLPPEYLGDMHEGLFDEILRVLTKYDLDVV